MHFKDRQEAGQQLSAVLAKYKGQDAVVYALPRGGVPVGYEVAKELGLPLELVIVRKIGHPLQPEYAVCAVTEGGHRRCNEEELKEIDPKWLEAATEKEREEARRRREVYLRGRSRMSPRGKIAIVVDDGIATGLTMFVAIDEIRKEHPREIVVAVPVTPKEVARKIAQDATLVALEIPDAYEGAVGAYYQEFPQIEDAEVVTILKKTS